MSSRDAILQRIRTELAKGPSVDPPPVPEVWPRTSPTTQQMIDRFSKELQAVQGEVIRCGSMDQARQKLAELLEQLDQQSPREPEDRGQENREPEDRAPENPEPGAGPRPSPIGAMDGPLCREVAAAVPAGSIVWGEPDGGPQSMAKFSAGLVSAEWLVADTGSCMISCTVPHQRWLCYLPPTCIVVARAEQLAEHMPAAWQPIAHQAADPARRGEFVLVTGPSRTADIEKILILGVHGPKRLVVLLLETTDTGQTTPTTPR